MKASNLLCRVSSLNPEGPWILVYYLTNVQECEAHGDQNSCDEGSMKFTCEYHVVEEPNYEFFTTTDKVDVMPTSCLILNGLAAFL